MSDYETAIRYEFQKFTDTVTEIIEGKIKNDFEERFKAYRDLVGDLRVELDTMSDTASDLSCDIRDCLGGLDDLSLPWE